MKKHIIFILTIGLFYSFSIEAKKKVKEEVISDRRYWCDLTYKISYPLLEALSKGELKKRMPLEQHENARDREYCSYLEAMGRLLCGISPWLESGESTGREGEQRAELTTLALKGIRNAVDPSSPDYMNFTGKHGGQPLVDAAFFAQALLRSPNVLWGRLDKETQQMVVAALRQTHEITPGFNNWLLFSAMIEAFFLEIGEDWDGMRVDYALRQHEQWYVGDGLYSDGPSYHWDYYNSFVIQPMILDISNVLLKHGKIGKERVETFYKRSVRYATILERLISPEGSYPAIGRSLAYRMGVFQSLSQISLMKKLPKDVSPAQVRSGLTAVMKRQMTAEGTFDANGWLTIGLCGHQPCVGEGYISTGSTYLCTVALLPLGLPASDEFWSTPAAKWTQQKVWSGEMFPIDHALYD